MRISRFLAAALLSGAVSQAVADSPYAGGVMIMNEETTGNPGNGSINFFQSGGGGELDLPRFPPGQSAP